MALLVDRLAFVLNITRIQFRTTDQQSGMEEGTLHLDCLSFGLRQLSVEVSGVSISRSPICDEILSIPSLTLIMQLTRRY